jgi:membrane carboxypeptidase/penicillin-binding protein PbpC
MLFQILSDGKNRARTFGISSILTTSLPMAVKTWTSTDFRDNWVIGYTKDIIIGIWVGNSDGSSMGDVSGVTGAGPLFHQIAEYMIGHGLIEKDGSPLTSWLENTLLCLDISCFQKESVTLRKNHTIESRPKSNIYKLHDFVTPMTDEERKKWKIQ